ncbi:MAG: hypothetical protein ACTHK3_09550 [Solirubrobacterales bacterium]
MSADGVITAPEGTAAELAETFAAADPESSRSRTLVWQDPVATAALGAEMSGLDYMRAVVTGTVPPRGERPLPRPQAGDRRGDAEPADSGKLLAHGIATCMILGG